MKIIKTLIPAILVIAACNSSVKNSQKADSTAINMDQTDTTLTARMTISPIVSKEGPVELNFIVYNQTDSTRTFCKWHTPFEPLMSKYLDITSNNQEVAYKGPMAKRVMPPPADSYISLAPGDSLSVTTDLLKGYEINNPGDYTIRYNAENMSGLKVTDSVSFTLK